MTSSACSVTFDWVWTKSQDKKNGFDFVSLIIRDKSFNLEISLLAVTTLKSVLVVFCSSVSMLELKSFLLWHQVQQVKSMWKVKAKVKTTAMERSYRFSFRLLSEIWKDLSSIRLRFILCAIAHHSQLKFNFTSRRRNCVCDKIVAFRFRVQKTPRDLFTFIFGRPLNVQSPPLCHSIDVGGLFECSILWAKRNEKMLSTERGKREINYWFSCNRVIENFISKKMFFVSRLCAIFFCFHFLCK